MKKHFTCLCILISVLCWTLPVDAANGSQRRFVERLLVEQGLDPEQARSIMQDSRISVRSDIVVKNLFFSKPKGSRQKPDVMDVNPRQIERGKAFIKEHTETFASVEKRFGVSRRIITAILIIESWLGQYPMTYGAVNAYVNLAFLLDPDYLKDVQARYVKTYPQLKEEATIARARSKAKWAVDELCYLIYLADHLELDPLTITGSFAGALGPAQFIPSSFWLFGIDGDRDGKSSPFNMRDAIPTVGHYLKKYGWEEDASVEQKRRAVWHYNHSRVYVNTVMMVYDELGR